MSSQFGPIEFKTSSFCSVGGCVEVGYSPDRAVVVRDSKDPLRTTSIVFSDRAWNAFVTGIRIGDFPVRG